VAEQFTGNKGKYVPLGDSIRSFQAILGGEVDNYPETAFSNAGDIDDVYARVKTRRA
jgi:F-type H+-transporting ATPase subunit beta